MATKKQQEEERTKVISELTTENIDLKSQLQVKDIMIKSRDTENETLSAENARLEKTAGEYRERIERQAKTISAWKDYVHELDNGSVRILVYLIQKLAQRFFEMVKTKIKAIINHGKNKITTWSSSRSSKI